MPSAPMPRCRSHNFAIWLRFKLMSPILLSNRIKSFPAPFIFVNRTINDDCSGGSFCCHVWRGRLEVKPPRTSSSAQRKDPAESLLVGLHGIESLASPRKHSGLRCSLDFAWNDARTLRHPILTLTYPP